MSLGFCFIRRCYRRGAVLRAIRDSFDMPAATHVSSFTRYSRFGFALSARDAFRRLAKVRISLRIAPHRFPAFRCAAKRPPLLLLKARVLRFQRMAFRFDLMKSDTPFFDGRPLCFMRWLRKRIYYYYIFAYANCFDGAGIFRYYSLLMFWRC